MSRRLIKFILLSCLIHSLTAIRFRSKQRADSIVIEVKERVKRSTTRRHRIDLTPGRGSGRMSASDSIDIDSEIKKEMQREGSANILNRKSVLFQTYFERIRELVEPVWAKSVQEAYKKKRLTEAFRFTLLVLFNSQGEITRTAIVSGNDNQILTDLAIRSMAGKTFPNPPTELIEPDGLGRIIWYFDVGIR